MTLSILNENALIISLKPAKKLNKSLLDFVLIISTYLNISQINEENALSLTIEAKSGLLLSLSDKHFFIKFANSGGKSLHASNG